MNVSTSKKTPSNLSILNVTILICLMTMWGGSFVAIKICLKYISPSDLVSARFIPSCLMLLPLGMWTYRKNNPAISFLRSLTGRQLAALLAASIFAVPAYHFCLNYGETMIPAGWASLVIALNPASITVFAALLLKEKIGSKRWLGIGLAFAGLLFISFTHDINQNGGEESSMIIKLLGILVVTGAVISWGAFTVISKQLISGHQPLTVLAWSITFGTLFMLPTLNSKFFIALAAAPAEFWWSLLYLSVGCTVIGFVLWFNVLKKMPASQAGAFIYLVPLFALISGNWLLKEPLDILIITGTTLVLGGVLLAGSNVQQLNQRKA